LKSKLEQLKEKNFKGHWLDFSLFDIPSAREVFFGIPQCILNGLTSALLCVPFIFADSESINLVVACDIFFCIGNDPFDYKGVAVLLCNG